MPVPVLIVDDEPMVRFTVEKILTQAGHGVQCADSGVACLEAVRAGFRGVILMDVMMPGLDGWETIDALAAEGLIEGNVVCMLTAVREPEERMETVKELILDYVRKPFQVAELVSKVEELGLLLISGRE